MPRYRIPRRLRIRLGGCVLSLPTALVTALGTVPVTPPHAAETFRSVPGPNAKLVFSDSFTTRDWGKPGAVWCPYSSAYPNGHTNPDDSKLDRITSSAVSLAKGGGVELRATPAGRRPGGRWDTGLLTTEPWDGGSCGGNGFTLRPGDYVVVHLRLPSRGAGGGHGAWPGVWTWKGGESEIDILEWHGETPDVAECVNHVRDDAYSFVQSRLLDYSKWVYVGARIGTGTVTWYLGSSPSHMRAVFSDGRGVPAHWRAYLVVNLSVSNQEGRTPVALTPITTKISSVQVYR
ncbi:hypothetical protein [Streptacidiphilus melanogenes]|uniref:hypothetical protein n=1 Tax=Streptacidiphilus melanogenes TaxID=411235 RepID=UPI00126A43C6|nr:hypothetical protein [Streptacidiphilus melanogenes]